MTSATALPATGRVRPKTDVQRVVLFLFIVVVISTVHAYVPVIGNLRPGLLLWLCLIGYPLIRPDSIRWANLSADWPPRALLFFGACTLLSIPFGLSMGQSGKYLIDVYSRVLIFGIILIVSIRHTRDMAVFVWSFVTSIGILTVLAFTVMDVGAVSGGIQRLQGTHMYDSNDMGVLFNIGLPLALLCLQTARTRLLKAAAGLTLLGIPAVIALFGSRGALVGLVAVTLTLLVTATHISLLKRFVLAPAFALALAVAAPPGYWDQMKTIINPGDDYNLTEADGRLALMRRGAVYMSQRPLFGVGLSNFGRAEGTSAVKAQEMDTGVGVKWTAPHNTYLQVGVELGAPALIIWITLIGGGTFGVVRARRRTPKAWARGTPDQRFLYYTGFYLPAAFVGFAVPSAFVSHAYLPQFYILVALLAGYRVLLRRELARSRRSGDRLILAARERALSALPRG